MEHTLGDDGDTFVDEFGEGLNPCFNGTYSRSKYNNNIVVQTNGVLILVLMEHTLGVILL